MSSLSSSEISKVQPCQVNMATLVEVSGMGRSGGISAPKISAEHPPLLLGDDDEVPLPLPLRRVTVHVIPTGTSMRSSDSGGRVCRVWLGGGGERLDAMVVMVMSIYEMKNERF